MKLLIINNLSSGLQDGSLYDYIRAFLQDGDEVVMRSTNGRTDLRTFLYDAEDYDLVVAAGGDGTISAVAYMLAYTGIPILPFPQGTANLLALNLYSPTETHALVKCTRDFHTMDFDMGEIVFPNDKKFGFMMMAGAGFDAAIMKTAEQTKKLMGSFAYFTSAFANFTPQFSKFHLKIDDRVIDTEGVGVLVMNFSKVQFDIPFVHNNLPRDGVFDIIVMNTKDALGLIPAFFSAFMDRGGESPERDEALVIYQGSSIEIEAKPELAVQFDGEVLENTTPISINMLPGAVRFVVSEECIRSYS